MPRPLPDLTDAELRLELERTADTLGGYSYNGVIDEMDRRAANRQTRASLILSVVGIVIAVVALIVSAFR